MTTTTTVTATSTMMIMWQSTGWAPHKPEPTKTNPNGCELHTYTTCMVLMFTSFSKMWTRFFLHRFILSKWSSQSILIKWYGCIWELRKGGSEKERQNSDCISPRYLSHLASIIMHMHYFTICFFGVYFVLFSALHFLFRLPVILKFILAILYIYFDDF